MRYLSLFLGSLFWGLLTLPACNSLLDWEDDRPCGNGVVSSNEECDDGNHAGGDGCSAGCLIEYEDTHKVDLLFVVDTTGSMVTVRQTLHSRFPELLEWLTLVKGGLPDLHLGLTSMDAGALGNVGLNCTENGDDGRLLKPLQCTSLLNQNYIVDLAPVGCTIAKAQRPGQAMNCTGHSCNDSHCRDPNIQGLEPDDLTLQVDGQGCPRCRNYVGEPMADVFGCLLTYPQSECGWEQPLETMMRALTSQHPENFNFRRPDAHLMIIFLTDEDDCSAATADLFNPETETLGPFSSFRCVQWGVRCNEAWDLDPLHVTENYTDCRPRLEVEDGKLVNVHRYVQELTQLVTADGHRPFVQAVALTGPHQTDLTVSWDSTSWVLTPAGEVEGLKVLPNLRLYDFAWRLSTVPEDMQWSFSSLLAPDWAEALDRLGQRLRDVMERSQQQ